MSHILTIHSHFMVPVIEAVTDAYKAFLKNRKRNSAVNATIKELSALSNRELSDLGISRGEIYSIANDSADMDFGKENENLKGWV